MYQESSNALIKHLVNTLRDTNTKPHEFRSCIEQIAKLLAYEAFNAHDTFSKTITTWQGPIKSSFIDENKLVFVPILRAGEPMLNGVFEIFKHAQSGFLAMKRDEQTAQSHLFYEKLPDLKDKTVVLLDPMVATGGSLNDGIDVIKQYEPKEIITLNIIGSPKGVKTVNDLHTDIRMYIAQIDEKLDENQYICPGLGDAGDRAFNTL